jgi:hypothetical protein
MDNRDKENEVNREKEPNRMSNTGKENKDKHADISHIDRREGDMENGELGGSMGQKRKETK